MAGRAVIPARLKAHLSSGAAHAVTALVRSPSPFLNKGVVSHIEKRAVDFDQAMRQWRDYCSALIALKWNVVMVPNPNEANDCADSVFIEDCIVMYKSTDTESSCAVVTRPGHISRQHEINLIETFLRKMRGISEIKSIQHPGTLDGGDVLKVGNIVYVGLSARTNAIGIQQFSAFLQSYGATVVPVPLSKVLHLKSAATALPCGTIIAWEDALDAEAIEIFKTTGQKKIIFVPEESGSHVVVIDERTVLMSHNAPKSMELFRNSPYNLTIVPINIDEYIKLEGCVTCLSVRVR